MSTDRLPFALADMVELLLQWHEEDKTPKTGAALALSAAVERYKLIRNAPADSEPETRFRSEPPTAPKRTL